MRKTFKQPTNFEAAREKYLTTINTDDRSEIKVAIDIVYEFWPESDKWHEGRVCLIRNLRLGFWQNFKYC